MMDNFDDWETQTSPLEAANAAKLATELVSAREAKEVVKKEMAELEVIIDRLEGKLLEVMKSQGLSQLKGDFGTISIKNTKSIASPASLEDKLQLFEYLRGQGIFEEMVSVNSRTLNSWANKEIEAKEQQGIFGWAPPGLKPAMDFQSLSVRKK
jgi:hypothetical protein